MGRFLVFVFSLLLIAEGTLAREIPSGWPPDAAVASAAAGDVIVVKDGIYRDASARIVAVGQEGKPITIRPTTPGGAILNGATPVLIVDSKHVVFDGFVFDQVWGRSVVRLESCRHVRVTNCAFIESGSDASTFPRIVEMTLGSRYCCADHLYMQGNLSMGVGCPYSRDTTPEQVNSYNRIDHIWFKDIIRRRGNGQEAVFLGGGMTDTPHHATVEYNLFDNASGDGEVISNKSGYNVLRYNTFRNCKGGLVLRGGRNVRVEGNYFFNMSPGLRIYGTEHEILHNHVQDCSIGIRIPTGTSYEVRYYNAFYQGLTNTRVANNTIVNSKGPAVRMGRGFGKVAKPSEAWKKMKTWDGNVNYDKPPKGNRFEKNLIVTNGTAVLEKIAGEDNVWEGNICVLDGTKPVDLKIDPKIVQMADAKIVRETGIAHPAPGSDLDAGCDYSVTGGKLGRPLTPRDVGPVWMAGDPSKVRRIPNPKTPPKK